MLQVFLVVEGRARRTFPNRGCHEEVGEEPDVSFVTDDPKARIDHRNPKFGGVLNFEDHYGVQRRERSRAVG